MKKNKFNLWTDGFAKYQFNKSQKNKIKKIKNKIINEVKKEYKSKKNISLEKFHYEEFKKKNFNDFRLKVIKRINNIDNLHNMFFEIFKEKMIDFFGKDIAVQKNINLTIQRPHDFFRAQLHRESPPDTAYEIVLWVPLVNCKKTMSLYLFPLKDSQKVEKVLKTQTKKENDLEKYALKKGIGVDVNFGEYIIFCSKVYHYIPINIENNTRWSINLRYKNMFSPYGKKGYLDYFKPIHFSEATNLALRYEK